MTDAVAAGHEEHHRGHERGEDRGVVQRSAHRLGQWRQPQAARRGPHAVGHLVVQPHGRQALRPRQFVLEAPPDGGRRHERREPFVAQFERVVVRGPEVDRELGPGGNHVDGVRLDRDPPHRGHGVIAEQVGQAFDRRDHLRRAGEGVVPVVHAGRARVVGDAAERNGVLPPAGDRGDERHAVVVLPHGRPLLDVHLDKPRVVGRAEPLRREPLGRRAVIGPGLPVVLAVAISQGCERRGVERARPAATAEHAEAEGRALLLGEHDRLERQVGATVLVGRPQHLERRHHANHAVEVAAARHAVEMRTREPDPLRPLHAPRPGVHIAGGIDPPVTAGPLGLGAKKVAGLPPGRRKRGPVGAGAGRGRAPGDRLDVGGDAVGADRHEETYFPNSRRHSWPVFSMSLSAPVRRRR